MVSCPQWTCISEAEWGRIGAEPRASDPRPALSIVPPSGPDLLTRLADEMARDVARERRQRVPLRSLAGSPLADGAEPLLVCYVHKGTARCGGCARVGLLHYSAVRSLARGGHAEGSQRVLVCPACLSQLPHRLLF